MPSKRPKKNSDEATTASKAGETESENVKIKGPNYANYWRILSFGARFEHVLLLIGLACAAASGAAMPLMIIVFGSLVGNFNSYGVVGGSNPADEFSSMVSRNSLYLVYIFIAKFVLSYVATFCFRTAGLRISAALRLSYLKALFSQPVKTLDQVSTGTVANTITSSANDIQVSVTDRLASLFQSLALVIAAYAIAFRYSWALTLAVSSGLVFILIVLGGTVGPMMKAQAKVAKADEQHTTVTSETLSSIRTVYAMGAEPKMIERHTEGVTAAHRAHLELTKWFAVQMPIFYFTLYSCYALAFWLGLKLYREGHINSISNVIVVFFSVLLVTGVIGQIVGPLVAVSKAITASTSFFKMIDADRIRTEGMKAPEASARHDIEFSGVTFAYPTRPGVEVLKKFNAVFREGKVTALVGPSGSGKSTIVALLERWYGLSEDSTNVVVVETPEATSKAMNIPMSEKPDGTNNVQNCGSIKAGGHEISDLDLKWWRSQIGLVQQEPFLFHDTIAKNVAYGLTGTIWEHVDEEKKLELVREACVEAFADEFINKLPQGYSTQVGEGGIKLSGGQRQRIAIARSIVRKPAILILDEATSAIDVHGEKIVQAALDRVSENRTTIMIAHRLSTIRKADHIIVLRNGQKVEEGTHTELLSQQDGLYTALVRAQQLEDKNDNSEDVGGNDILSAIKPEITRTSTHQSAVKNTMNVTETADVEKGHQPRSHKGQSLFRGVGIIMREQRSKSVYAILAVCAAMACGGAFALQSWFFAHLIQTFQYTGQQLIDAANFWALMFFVLALGCTVAYAALCMGCGIFSNHVGTNCRQTYFSSALKMPISYFDDEGNTSGSVMQRLSGDPRAVQELLGINSAFPLASFSQLIGSAILAFYFGWKLTLVVFFAVLPVMMGATFLRMRYEVHFDKNQSKVFSTSSQFATEATGAFRTVTALGMEDVVIKRYDNLLSDQIRASTRKASYATLLFALTDSVELCCMALAFWYGGQLLLKGEYSAFQFFVIYNAIVQGSQVAGIHMSLIPNFASATAAINRILDLRSQVRNKVLPISPPKISDVASGAEISFRDVTFQYEGIPTPLFNHLNINIQAGQFVAFVGPSGCGKTTVVSMLERFYEPVSGTIYVDGEDISALDVRSYRNKLALVSQEPRLFSGTLKDNLLLGVSETSATEEQMHQACRDAEMHDFIISLPQGYDTELGTNAQTTLSGGQKQRLCLARALLRKPKLLLLDEATSSLDSQSEKLVQGAIERLATQKNMTVIAVAHRLATIQKADVIFVFGERDTEMAKGSRIVEKGTHDELMRKRGVYWSMCKAQALDR